MTSARMRRARRVSARVLVRGAFGLEGHDDPHLARALREQRSDERAKPLVTGYNFSEPYS